jgi:hypothetical protein
VEEIGATIPTFPRRTAAYTSASPATFPKPEAASQPSELPCGASPPATSRAGTVGTSPTSITQPSVGRAPIVRLARVEQSVVAAQAMAAPRPPTIAITCG